MIELLEYAPALLGWQWAWGCQRVCRRKRRAGARIRSWWGG